LTEFRLGINCGFAINRYVEPEVWTQIVGEKLGLRYVQFVADLLNPFLPEEIINAQIERILKGCRKYNIAIQSTFTSAFTRVNHLLHPEPAVREAWFEWFRKFFRISRALGAEATGSHFGILSVRDFEDESRRRQIIAEGIRNWRRLSEFAKELGFEYLLFEPMSIPREMASTIDETKRLLEAVNEGAALPILLNLDVDHGDLGSDDPRDRNPYAWLETFAQVAPAVHIKQSLEDKAGHWPFTEEFNKRGNIRAERVLEALDRGGAKKSTLLLEISHRERYPAEYQVLDDLRKSVEYWRKFVKD